jgi:hypothetical protein
MMKRRSLIALCAIASSWLACGDDDQVAGVGDGGAPSEVALTGTPTWYEHIQPFLHEKCSACHRPDKIAPFSMLDYASAKPFAAMMVKAVEEGRMPPFQARETPECTPKHPFADDPRLSATQLDMLRKWAANGAPEGDKSAAAPLKEPPPVDIERADAVLTLPEPITVVDDGSGDLHTCLIADPKILKDGYVVSRQVTSGNEKVLHHVTTYIVAPALTDGTVLTREQMNEAFVKAKGKGIGQRYDCFGGPTLDSTGLRYSLLGSWAPGGKPVTSPPDSGQPVKAGSVVVLDMHYHPIPSGPEVDSKTSYSLQFADKVPRLIANPVFQGFADVKQAIHTETANGVTDLLLQPGETQPEFLIPAGASKHVEQWQMKWKLPLSPLKIYFAASHMHYAGVDLMVQLLNGTPQPGEDPVECLERTPNWDFNWQLGYSWDTPYENLPTLHDGDIIRSPASTTTRAPKQGEVTLDEMCLSLMGISYPNSAYVPRSRPKAASPATRTGLPR